MKLNILVTGSKGVVGQKLVKVLTDRGHNVKGIDLHHAEGERGYAQKMGAHPYNYERCDISEYRQLERIFNGRDGMFDIVYNCAAEFGR